ncbi:MAG TPA: PhoH family protein, partial [Bacteroidales bacterium]|nr:PhoH family protein [Bacteroidales bacterium]
ICDEAQNATKNLIRDVVTRAGRNTKVIVAGDPRQIDNTSLDAHNNGLVYLKDCMKGSTNCAILRFENENCVRSALAEDAIDRMK